MVLLVRLINLVKLFTATIIALKFLDRVECLPATTKTRWPQPIFIPREAPNLLSNFLFRNDIPKLSI